MFREPAFAGGEESGRRAFVKRSLDRPVRYGVAVLAVGAAVLVKWLLDPLTAQDTPFLLILGAIMVGAWYGGLGPGLLATALSALAIDYFFLDPKVSFTTVGPELLDVGAFVVEGVLVCVLTASLRSARDRAEQSTLEAESHQESLRESEERFRLMVEGVKDYAFFMLDPKGCVTTWNEGAERVEGYRAAEILGRHFSVFYTDEEVAAGRPEEKLRAAAEAGRYEEEGPRVRKDGSTFWASVVVTALEDENGNLRGFSKVVQDTTESKHTDEVLRFLVGGSATLASSLDYRTTLSNVAGLAVPALADWCAVDVLDDDGSVERLAVEHSDPAKIALAFELQERNPQDPDTTRGVRKVLETGEPDMMAEIPEELLDQAAVDAEHREMMRKLGLKSYMVVPMVARGRNHGAITFVSAESGRRYDESDLRLAEELSRRAALAVDNAKLYEEAQREISDRKVVEARLKEAEARFRTLVEHIPAITYMEASDKHAENNAFLYISPQVEAVLGYPPEEWISDPHLFRKTIHPDDRERVLAEDARTNLTGEPFQMEYRQRAKDGRIVWVRDESVLVRDHEGRNPYWLGVQFDITDRREAEEALRQSEGRYRTVVKQAAEGIFIVDIETKLILEANAAYRNLLGYSAQDMLGLGLTLYDVVAHDRESIDRYVERILRNRVEFIGERRHRRKDGSLVDVEVGSSVVSYGGGEALCVIVHDITERRRSAERLQRSLDALLALYEAGQILGSSLQREEIGSRLLEIARRVSSLTAAVIAVPNEEGELKIWRSTGLEGLRRDVRFSPEALASRERVLQTRKHQAVRLPADADEPYIVGLNLPLVVRDRIIGVLEAYGPESLLERQNEETLISLANQGASALENARLYADLAERENRLQDLIRRLITAQEEERRKVSYEVHDGLAQTAAGAHQLLQAFSRRHPPDTEQGRKDLDRVLQLVQQTVGEARYVIADLRPTALDDLGLGAAVRLQVEKISEEGREVDYEEALGNDRLPTEVETALFRVTQEALTNVRKHAPSARVKIALRQSNNGVQLQVRDWGPGFDPEKATDGGGPGERLGLSSMRERVALLGGNLEVRSKPGEGTEVVAEIPSVHANGKEG
jgi:PAS domain S-box-containing protein